MSAGLIFVLLFSVIYCSSQNVKDSRAGVLDLIPPGVWLFLPVIFLFLLYVGLVVAAILFIFC